MMMTIMMMIMIIIIIIITIIIIIIIMILIMWIHCRNINSRINCRAKRWIKWLWWWWWWWWYIDNTDIIGSITLNDNSAQKSKNTVKASIFDPQNNWSSRSVSFFNSDFVQADRGTIKTGTFTYSGVTNYYNARIGVEKELIQSRFSKEISFTIGQKGLLLKAGQVIAVTYAPFRFDKKLFRIENATFNANCTVNIKAREYDDSIYVISKQIRARIYRRLWELVLAKILVNRIA